MTVSPAFDRRLAELSPASDRVWIAGLVTGLALTVVAAFAPLPKGGGTMCAYVGLLFGGYALAYALLEWGRAPSA